MFSETRYALNGDLRVAYRASREGPRDIVVVPKLADAHTNDTLSAKGGVAFAPLPMPEPLYPVAIVAKTGASGVAPAFSRAAASIPVA